MSDERVHSDDESYEHAADGEDEQESVAELVGQLGRDASRLALHETALNASERVPELRRAALGGAAAAVVVLAFLAAFALANWAVVSGLSSVWPTWLAALVLALAWLAVAVALGAVLLRKIGHSSGIQWWRMLGSDRDEARRELQASRDEAEQALRDTIDRLTGAMALATVGQLADAIAPLGDAAADIGEELLEASEDVVDVIEEQLPGGGAVGQMVDVVLYPGRLGLRVATTVLRGSPKDASD